MILINQVYKATCFIEVLFVFVFFFFLLNYLNKPLKIFLALCYILYDF